LGEFSCIEWLGTRGDPVYVPVGHAPDVDLVAEIDGRLLRIQVKTSTAVVNGRYTVAVCTRGGNQSWSGLVKRFSKDRCDWLFVLVGDGRRWFIPAEAVEGTICILLGGPKYAEYEVERGRPLVQMATA
jgi:PD-(D/E)XK endonuclease